MDIQKTEEPIAKKDDDQPKSLQVASRGIKTGRDFADFMSCLMSDIVAGRVTPQVGNAACNAGGKLLKVVEMQYKYGDTTPGRPKTLILALGDEINEGPSMKPS